MEIPDGSRERESDPLTFANGIDPDEYARRVIEYEFESGTSRERWLREYFRYGTLFLLFFVYLDAVLLLEYLEVGGETARWWIYGAIAGTGLLQFFAWRVAVRAGWLTEGSEDPDEVHDGFSRDRPDVLELDFIIDGNRVYFGSGGRRPEVREWFEFADRNRVLPRSATLARLDEIGFPLDRIERKSRPNPAIDLSRLSCAGSSGQRMLLRDKSGNSLEIPGYFPLTEIRRELESRGVEFVPRPWDFVVTNFRRHPWGTVVYILVLISGLVALVRELLQLFR